MLKSRTILLCATAILASLTNCTFGDEKLTQQGTSEVSSSPVSVTFLDIEAGKAAIIDDSLDPYFDQMQEMEMSAKTGSTITGESLEEQRKECRRRFQTGVREFTEAEKEAIAAVVKNIYPVLEQRYPFFSHMPWSFLKVSNKIEGGLSHTRDKHIIFSEGTCGRFAMLHQSDPERAASAFASLLVHEQMHVFQRVYPGVLDSLYTDIWGFIKAEEITSCPWLEKHHLVNPDGTDCRWVFPIQKGDSTTYILPLVVFAEGEGLKRMGRDFRMIAVELLGSAGRFRPKVAEDGKPVFRNLLQVPEYGKVFPSTGNIYHPNEACASLFARIVMLDSSAREDEQDLARRDRIEIELGPLRKWFTENLSQKPPSKPSTEAAN